MTDKELFNASNADFQREMLRRSFAETDKKIEECRKKLHTYGSLAKLSFYLIELEHEAQKMLVKMKGLI